MDSLIFFTVQCIDDLINMVSKITKKVLYILLIVVLAILAISFIRKNPGKSTTTPSGSQKTEVQGKLVDGFPKIDIPDYFIVKDSSSDISPSKKIYIANWTVKPEIDIDEVIDFMEDEYFPTWLVDTAAEERNETSRFLVLKKDNATLRLRLVKLAKTDPMQINMEIQYD